MLEYRRFETMQYLIRYPKGYCDGERYPVILLLHGAGSRGTSLRVLEGNDFFTLTEQFEDFPFVTVAPQCHENTWFDLLETLKRFAEQVSDFGFCDPARLYLVGTSMGGYGAWQLAMSVPWLFAAMIPICGGGMYWNAARLKQIPVWAFHGALDTLVRAEESVKMTDAVNACGGNAGLTVYPDCAHECWRRVYADREVYDWLLSHRREM